MRSVPVAEFRRNCTELIREVENTKEPIIVTRHGKPVVEVRPARGSHESLRGSVVYESVEDLIHPAVDPDDWEATR